MKTSKAVRLVLLILILSASSIQVHASCTLPPTTHADNISTLSDLLPGDARGALAVDIEGLLGESSAAWVNALLNDTNGDPALKELFSAINKLAENINLAGLLDTALLVQTTNASDGLLLLAQLSCNTIGDVTILPALTPDGTYGTGAHAMYIDVNSNSLSLLDDGVLIVGKPAAVQSVLDVADGATATSDIDPFLSVLENGSPFSFIYGLPAMFKTITADLSLSVAEVVSGSLDFTGANISGSVSFHTSNASTFVDKYNELDAGAIYAGGAPLALNAPIANGLSQVVVTIPTTPINKSGDDLVSSRNTLKKLILGMEAWDYAKDVVEFGNKPLLALTVLSEEDGADIPGNVFIRREFRPDKIPEFEANELPEGFTLADCKFLEGDMPAKFLALNLYNGGGGSVVTGARAEWDVFVNPPVGADPDAGTRPRFLVIDALAEAVSVDAVHGLTPAEPCDHYFDGGLVISDIAKYDTDGVTEIPVFSSSFPKPNPLTADVARFTRELANSNDYIYWGHGVYDRTFYNASAYNHDAYLADISQVTINDLSHWNQYLEDDPTYVIYYVNTLEFVGSPMDNLDSAYLDITPEWLNELKEFKYNGHELSWMIEAVQNLFKGRADALAQFVVENATPATYYNFEISDIAGMTAALNLPAGCSLEPTHFFDSDTSENHYLTLSIYEKEGSAEGTRAEWSIYVDDGKSRGGHKMIIDLQTEDAALDPVSMLNLPSMVSHDLTSGTVSTSLSSTTIGFNASFSTANVTAEGPSLDWIEAEELVCYLNGICNKLYYNAETMAVPLQLPLPVTVTMSTPWDTFINTTPSSVFYRDNSQEYVTKAWENLKVDVADPPEPPICFEGTHTITGTGEMIGRTNSSVNSTYTYYGGGSISGNNLEFYLDQTINNVLGVSHILTSVSFDIATGVGTSTLEGCTGPAMMCADVNPKIGKPEGTSIYTAEGLDASNPDNITWEVNFELFIDLMGWADSASTLAATLGDPMQPEICGNGVDDDCDGDMDCDDSDCTGTPYCMSWFTPASVVNSEYKESSDMANYLFLLCIPVGAVLLWRGLRLRK